MKVTHIEAVTEDRTILDDILCNKCGESCKTRCGNYEGILEHVIRGSYDAKLGDQVEYEFSICEMCLEGIFRTFHHPPKTTDLMDGKAS